MCCKPPSNPITGQHLARSLCVAATASTSLLCHPKESVLGLGLGAATGVAQAAQAWWRGRSLTTQSCTGKACAAGLTNVLTGGLPMGEGERRLRTAILMVIYQRCLSKELFAFSTCLDFPRSLGYRLACRVRKLDEDQLPLLPYGSTAEIVASLARVGLVAFALKESPRIAAAGLAVGGFLGALCTYLPSPDSACKRGGCNNGFSDFMSNSFPISSIEAKVRSSALAALHISCNKLGVLFSPFSTFEFFSPLGRAFCKVSQGAKEVDWKLGLDVSTVCALALTAFAAYRQRSLAIIGAVVGFFWGVIQQSMNASPAKAAMAIPGGCMRDFSGILQRHEAEVDASEAEVKNGIAMVAHSSKMPAFAAYCCFDLARAAVLRPMLSTGLKAGCTG